MQTEHTSNRFWHWLRVNVTEIGAEHTEHSLHTDSCVKPPTKRLWIFQYTSEQTLNVESPPKPNRQKIYTKTYQNNKYTHTHIYIH